MDDELVQRYTRQMILQGFGEAGQEALQDAHVLILGLGGLGSPAALYLAAAGIGEMTLIDFDRVSISNLHRQILYTDDAIGHKKTSAAGEHLMRCNPGLKIHTHDKKLSDEELNAAIAKADIVLDCSDNFATRYSVNAACVQQGKPLVSGAAIRWEAQISVFNLNKHSPCYACLYPDASDIGERCSEVGVIGPLVGIIGSMQAMETIKIITSQGDPLDSRLLILDGKSMQWRSLKLNKEPNCKVCGVPQ